MNLVIGLEAIGETERGQVGGKAFALGAMVRHGLPVPPAVVVGPDAYRQYMTETGLGERILLELARKRFEDLRWEEMWDAALRIRSMFLNTALPGSLREELTRELAPGWGETPVVVRSSALDEDASGSSFAGLHESYVNVRGLDSILDHIRLVWASLWSDAALLYRQELGLDVAKSAMAVLVQELVTGERSGVAVCVDPTDPDRALVEAVHGLNQGLVDGTVEPDRWTLDRRSGTILDHRPAERCEAARPSSTGVLITPLEGELTGVAPLGGQEVQAVFGLARRCEELFGPPQDVEWTYAKDRLFVLQSRPITAGGQGEDGQRSWYLSLRRSYDNLQKLGVRIEGELIPAMIAEAAAMAELELGGLSDLELAAELDRRLAAQARWTRVYRDEFIPFAHGARLFGQIYNDAMRPEDPFEFITLLSGSSLASVKRHDLMGELAQRLRDDPRLAEGADGAGYDPPGDLRERLDELVGQLGAVFAPGQDGLARSAVLRLLRATAGAEVPVGRARAARAEALEQEFLGRFAEDQRTQAQDLLDLARTSYRLRDDDNIHLGQVEAELNRAALEGRRRLSERGAVVGPQVGADQVSRALRDPGFQPMAAAEAVHAEKELVPQARQLTGQPAGPGLATGAARVILQPADLLEFRGGEVLVCDAIDPNITFVVPLCAAIVERRGGMLIHGAIIAREYGLPCVTGVPQASELIRTGDTVTVDGYLGIVVIRPGGDRT
jgi:phosphohistidine swiveling domain-containing protein